MMTLSDRRPGLMRIPPRMPTSGHYNFRVFNILQALETVQLYFNQKRTCCCTLVLAAGDAVYLHLYAQLIQGSKCFLEQHWACISLFLSMSLFAAQHYEGLLCYFSCTICLASFSMCVPFHRKQHKLEASK